MTGLFLLFFSFGINTSGSTVEYENLRLHTVTQDSGLIRDISRKADAVEAIRSLLIQQDGVLIAEKYFDGMSGKRAVNIKSASKSIISLLIGIAIDRDLIKSKKQPIPTFFPDYFSNTTDSLKRIITIENLLTMQSGLETTSFHNYGRWVTSDDWVEFALEQPMVEKPGGEMVYSTGTSHLLSVILTKATKMSTRQFAMKYLFGPMEITLGGWDRDPQGYYMGGNNMAMKPTDMLKIGQMVLNGGTYNGNRIISKEWLQASFKTYTRSIYNPYDYGYMWWNKPVGEFKVFFSWGYGGQYIFMIPELQSVVVITSSLANADQSRSYKEPVFELLEFDIIPLLSIKKMVR